MGASWQGSATGVVQLPSAKKNQPSSDLKPQADTQESNLVLLERSQLVQAERVHLTAAVTADNEVEEMWNMARMAVK